MTKERRSLSEVLRNGPPTVPTIGEQVIGDDVKKGLCLRLRAGATPTWIYRWRVKGKLIKRTLARAETMTLDQARAAAEAVAGAAAAGPARVSLRQFAATFLRDCAPRWKPSTIEGHRHDLNGLILPTLGDLAIDRIGHADVTAWRDQLDIAGRSKDRATLVLSSLIRHAEMLGLRPAGANPCAGQRRHRSDFKARYLSAPDYRRPGLAHDQAAGTDPIEVTCIRFLTLTGARRCEALSLEWSMIQTDRAALPDSKTGPKCLWLADPVRQLLSGLHRVKVSPFVFVRPCGRGIASSLDRVWRSVRKTARLDGLRLHDLRHSYASVAVSNGEELRTVAALLGLGHLSRLPIHSVKIDCSMIQRLLNDPASQAIVRAIIELCHELGLQTVAEGVECDEQQAFLTQLGCSMAQGYGIAQPMPLADTLAWMTKAERNCCNPGLHSKAPLEVSPTL